MSDGAPHPPNLHASCVAFGPARGVLILGPSGAGKSRLALALIGQGARLVADDQVLLSREGNTLFARAPRPTEGLIEARGLGLLRLVPLRLARIVLAIDLAAPPARLPDPVPRPLGGVTIPCLPGQADSSFAAGLRHYLHAMRVPD
ncbi:HPr kinase/phosphorylase [Pararhodobacter marinus]|uniref:Serine kinase n=1 Tax=Pararhodobacter marinus TaxID=2184063 RepID=A0A2U2C3Y8_9RHOB|nr:HPr kinase/phosphatase C-terminal domain-containing protein [Pararhodobacter marinus]PWE26583.1 serine kinase [Pararhodobacter marinus]